MSEIKGGYAPATEVEIKITRHCPTVGPHCCVHGHFVKRATLSWTLVSVKQEC